MNKLISSNALVLFDIDGTLIRRAGPHHREALQEAIYQTVGVRVSIDGIPVAGMLDPDIISRMMLRADFPRQAIRTAMPAIIQRAQITYSRMCPNLERKVCPGVRLLLKRLKKSGVPAALVTGNLTAIGWKKMERAGLLDYFCFGAFAEMAKDRAGLVKIAVAEARRSGRLSRGGRISLIGDHPNDVLAAQRNKIRSIAVATGVVGANELAAYNPDLLVPDMRSLTVDLFL
jgi:phosphoglycolate phosphatase